MCYAELLLWQSLCCTFVAMALMAAALIVGAIAVNICWCPAWAVELLHAWYVGLCVVGATTHHCTAVDKAASAAHSPGGLRNLQQEHLVLPQAYDALIGCAAEPLSVRSGVWSGHCLVVVCFLFWVVWLNYTCPCVQAVAACLSLACGAVCAAFFKACTRMPCVVRESW